MDVALLTEFEKTQVAERQPLPDRYLGLSDDEMAERIAQAKADLGSRLLILGHHYQRDEVIRFADYTGDSFRLAGQAAKCDDADYIVFCGVHFMAESADVLSAPNQQVVLPDLAAGCSLADMAAADEVEVCWEELNAMGATDVVPVTYINSAAAIKAFCGERGGVVCTSGNARPTLEWAWAHGRQVLFLPDQHLGRNTAYAMGVPLDQMVVWDPELPNGGVQPDALRAARLILWKGHCSVHERFTVAQVEQVRRRYPDVRVIVHPECSWDVVQAADESGSTERIIRTITASPPGSIWAVGTEVHLVNRLAAELAPERTVLTLDPIGCLCSTMFRVSPNHLLWVLEGLREGAVHNRITVPDTEARWARAALDRMLEIH
ncbi:MAG: quinolinate synthase NadA [Acidobacteria bacterium]|nr:quinolinate synthase NadA [Acidobacteriota bacterium]MYD70346.1 quinolinate synthase NadA [Acidobacteriota bacterium]